MKIIIVLCKSAAHVVDYVITYSLIYNIKSFEQPPFILVQVSVFLFVFNGILNPLL